VRALQGAGGIATHFVLTATLSFPFARTATLCFKRGLPAWKGASDLKGVTNEVMLFYASEHCHFMIQGTEFLAHRRGSSFASHYTWL